MAEPLQELGIPVNCGQEGCDKRICVPFSRIVKLELTREGMTVSAAHAPSIECDNPECGEVPGTATITDPLDRGLIESYAPASASRIGLEVSTLDN